MTDLRIDGLRFVFDDSWLVARWDDSSWYRAGIEKLKGQVDGRAEATKAVDVVGLRDHVPYLFEVKDFRGYAIENKLRQVQELPVELGLEVVVRIVLGKPSRARRSTGAPRKIGRCQRAPSRLPTSGSMVVIGRCSFIPSPELWFGLSS
ncbi:MAG TPA: hypothetical protein VFT22_09715 [Kofleriaceae bacterium]|nr:hypothetical protein [Kofleriaceae bacterium]